MRFEVKKGYQTPIAEEFGSIIIKERREIYKDIKVSKEMKKEIEAFMKFVMKVPRCLALSANQCSLDGKDYNKDYFYIKGFPEPFVYPVILKKYGDPVERIESCVSFPGKNIIVDRYLKVRIKYMDQNSRINEFDAQGLLAQIIQHEYDHLSGVNEVFTRKQIMKEIPRNIPCPCGSKLKYKNCCMKLF